MVGESYKVFAKRVLFVQIFALCVKILRAQPFLPISHLLTPMTLDGLPVGCQTDRPVSNFIFTGCIMKFSTGSLTMFIVFLFDPKLCKLRA